MLKRDMVVSKTRYPCQAALIGLIFDMLKKKNAVAARANMLTDFRGPTCDAAVDEFRAVCSYDKWLFHRSTSTISLFGRYLVVVIFWSSRFPYPRGSNSQSDTNPKRDLNVPGFFRAFSCGPTLGGTPRNRACPLPVASVLI